MRRKRDEEEEESFMSTVWGSSSSRTAVPLAILSRSTSLPSWRSRLKATSMASLCSTVGLSSATRWTNAAATPAGSSRGLRTVATTTTLEDNHQVRPRPPASA